jgi:hypothetical protein
MPLPKKCCPLYLPLGIKESLTEDKRLLLWGFSFESFAFALRLFAFGFLMGRLAFLCGKFWKRKELLN